MNQHSIASAPKSDLLEVPRRRGLDGRSLYRDYLEPGQPVILEDACAAWPAHKSWSLEMLVERFGERRFMLNGKEVSLGSALQAVAQCTPERPAPYIRECYLGLTLPELLPDVEPLPGDVHNRLHARGLPSMGKVRRTGSPELLVAGAGTAFPVLHYDTMHTHALITQIRGSKTFWLYPPDQTQFLYADPKVLNISRIDRFDPVDPQRWPDHARARSVCFEIHPGETVFVPSGWWHRTRVSELSIAVTWNAVCRSNWPAFIEDKYVSWTRGSALKTALKQLYFGAVGALQSRRDAV